MQFNFLDYTGESLPMFNMTSQQMTPITAIPHSLRLCGRDRLQTTPITAILHSLRLCGKERLQTTPITAIPQRLQTTLITVIPHCLRLQQGKAEVASAENPEDCEVVSPMTEYLDLVKPSLASPDCCDSNKKEV